MLNLGSIAIVVSDGKESAEWYRDKLGFEIRDREGHWITVAPKGERLLLHLCEGDTLEPGNTGIAFHSPDVAKEEARLRQKGVKITKKTTKANWATFASFADPDGNEFWILEE